MHLFFADKLTTVSAKLGQLYTSWDKKGKNKKNDLKVALIYQILTTALLLKNFRYQISRCLPKGSISQFPNYPVQQQEAKY